MQMQFSYRVNDHNIVCVYGSQRTVPQCGEKKEHSHFYVCTTGYLIAKSDK